MSNSMKVEMNALVFKGISDVIKATIMTSLVEAGKVHGFDGEAEFERQGFELVVKESKKKVAEKEKKEKMILPFEKAHVNYDGCQGIVYNKGLFTQCEKARLENGKYCKTCQSEASKSDTCEPLCGNIDRRLNYGLYDYKDNKGRSPKNYGEFIANLGLNVTDIEVRALHELKYKISPEHFSEPEKKDNSRRGRPKKESVPIESKDVSDIFLQLTKGDDETKAETEKKDEVLEKPKLTRVPTDEYKPVAEKKGKKPKMSDEEKEAKKEAEKKEKEAKKEAEKLQKEAEKKEREAKKEAEKKEREAKKEAEKKEKEAKKDTNKKVADKKEEEEEEPEPPKKITVCRIQINKKNYLWDKNTKIVYDPETKEEIGIYNEETKTIDALPEEEEEDDNKLDSDSDEELDTDNYN